MEADAEVHYLFTMFFLASTKELHIAVNKLEKLRCDFEDEVNNNETRRFFSVSNFNLYCKAESWRMQSEEWRV